MNGLPTAALDHKVAMTRVGGDAELLKEIAVLFLENYQGWVQEIRQAHLSGNADALLRAAHGLKGSVANFGAREAVEASLKLENLGRGHDLAAVPETLAALEAALETLRGDLERL